MSLNCTFRSGSDGKFYITHVCVLSCFGLYNSLRPQSLPGSSDHGGPQGKNSGAGCHALLQGDPPNPRKISCISWNWQVESSPLSHLGNQRRPQNRDPPGRVLEWGKESCAHFSRGPGRTEEVSEHPHGVAHGDSTKAQHECAACWAPERGRRTSQSIWSTL